MLVWVQMSSMLASWSDCCSTIEHRERERQENKDDQSGVCLIPVSCGFFGGRWLPRTSVYVLVVVEKASI